MKNIKKFLRKIKYFFIDINWEYSSTELDEACSSNSEFNEYNFK